MREISAEEEPDFIELGFDEPEFTIEPPSFERSMDILAVTGEVLNTPEAKSKVTQYSPEALREVLSMGEAFNMSLGEVRAKAIEITEKQRAFEENDQFLAAQALMYPDNRFEFSEANLVANIQYAIEATDKAIRQGEKDNSVIGDMSNFVYREIIRAPFANIPEAFTDRGGRSSTEIMSRAFGNPKEFIPWYNSYLKEIGEEGVAGVSIGALERLKEEVKGLGYDPRAGLTRVFSLLDIPTVGTIGAGIKLTKKGLGIGSAFHAGTKVGQVAAIKGEQQGAQAAERILDNTPDPETLVGRGDATQDLSGQADIVRPNNNTFNEKLEAHQLAKDIDLLDRQGAFGRSVTKQKIQEAANAIVATVKQATTNVARSDPRIVNEGFGNWLVTVRFGKARTGEAYPPQITRSDKKLIAQYKEGKGIPGPGGTVVQPSRLVSEFGETEGIPIQVSAATRKNVEQTPEELAGIQYKIPSSAKKAAEKLGPTAKIVQLDPSDASKGYVIEVTERISTLGLQDKLGIELNLKNDLVRRTVGRLFNNSIMGSAALRDNERLTTLAQMGQAGNAAVRDIVRPYEKSLRSLDSKAKFTINAVYAKLRDGPDAHTRTRYTEAEFADEYQKLHPTGASATQKEFEAYENLASVEETDYLIKASNALQRFLAAGYNRAVEVAKDVYVPAKQIRKSDLKADDIVLDIEGKVYGRSNDDIVFGDLPDNLPVWKLDKPLPTGQSFVIGPTNVRLIDPTDVIGYNPGGRRFNPTAKFFVVIGGEGKRLRSLLSSFTEADARIAKKQLTAIRDALRQGSSDIDNIIANNSDWAGGLSSKAEFDDLIAREGWVKNPGDPWDGEIGYKARDGALIEGELDNPDIWAGASVNDFVQNDMMRQDKVLMDYGGGKNYNTDPVTSVFDSFSNSVFTYTNKAYTQNAMVGWVKAALSNEGINTRARTEWFANAKGVSENDYEMLFKMAKVTGNDDFAVRMRELRDITTRRLNMEDEPSRYMAMLGSRFADYVFEGKMPFGVLKGKKLTFLGKDPTNLLLKVGFQSSFGFFNASQWVMQGLHATTIMGVAGANGLKGAAMAGTSRALLTAVKDPDAYKEGVKRFAKYHGLTEDSVEELFEYIRTSGRAIVDGDAIEAGTGIAWNFSGWRGNPNKYKTFSAKAQEVTNAIGKGFDFGLIPFNQGERFSRLTAINTAFLEYKTKYPTLSAMSDHGREWITRREQALTLNMTTADRAKVQASLMKVPTQWLSYSLRSAEAIFVGRGLTKGERARLFFMMAPMYGLSGFGFANAADYIGEKLGWEPGGTAYVGLKYGFLDALSHAMGGEEGWVGLGKRLAPIDAFLDTYKKIFEEETYLALAGPSGEISQNIVESFYAALADMYHGRSVLMTENLARVLRQPSALNNYAKALGILNNGIYRNKHGVSVGDEMGITQAIITATGFSPGSVQEIYQRKSSRYNTQADLRKFRKEINEDAETAFRLISSGDSDRGRELIREIQAKIAISGFTYKERMSLARSSLTPFQKDFQQIYIQMFKNGENAYGRQAFRKLTTYSEESE